MNTYGLAVGVFSVSDVFGESSVGLDSSGSEKAPAACSIFFNSPDSKSSVTTSHPPTNSPFMNSCGYVFHSLDSTEHLTTYLTYFRFFTTDLLVRIFALAKSQPRINTDTQFLPRCFKICTTRRLNPQTGFDGVPFIKSITLFSRTIYTNIQFSRFLLS